MSKTTTRKSFIIHKDSLDILEKLSNEEAGILFKAICAYQQGSATQLNYPLDLVFLPFQKQFDRDNEKYLNTCKQRAEAGSKGGKQKVANASKSKQKVANVADSKSKSKSKSKSDSDKAFNEFYENYPKKTERKKTMSAFNKLSKDKQKLATEDSKTRYIEKIKEDGTNQFVPAPLVYINGERWEDERAVQQSTQRKVLSR
jgi:hypothetical protein